MNIKTLGAYLDSRGISTTALAKEIGIDRQRMDYWLNSGNEIYVCLDPKTMEIASITTTTSRTLYEKE